MNTDCRTISTYLFFSQVKKKTWFLLKISFYLERYFLNLSNFTTNQRHIIVSNTLSVVHRDIEALVQYKHACIILPMFQETFKHLTSINCRRCRRGGKVDIIVGIPLVVIHVIVFVFVIVVSGAVVVVVATALSPSLISLLLFLMSSSLSVLLL